MGTVGPPLPPPLPPSLSVKPPPGVSPPLVPQPCAIPFGNSENSQEPNRQDNVQDGAASPQLTGPNMSESPPSEEEDGECDKGSRKPVQETNPAPQAINSTQLSETADHSEQGGEAGQTNEAEDD